jgi:hypothetical protein
VTQIDYAALIASFPNNNVKAITASNMRDFVDSVMLYWDNVVVVKPTQPEGNAFPTPVANVITLAANTLYLVNGGVTVEGELTWSAGSVVASISGDPTMDYLILDNALTSHKLIKATSVSGGLYNVGLSTANSGSSIFGMTTTVNFSVWGCRFATSKMGSWAGSTGRTWFKNCRTASITDKLSLTGTFVFTRFDDFSTGTTQETVDIVNFGTSTHTDLRIENCVYNMAASQFLFENLTTGDFTEGKFLNCTPLSGNAGNLCTTTLDDDSNVYFHGCEGYDDTFTGVYPYGGLVFSGNSTSTVSTGAGNFVKIVSNNTDVLISQSTGLTRSATMQITVANAGDYWVTATGSLRRASGATGINYDLQLFVNGTAYANGGQTFKGRASVYNQADTIAFNDIMTLAANDVLEFRVAPIGSSVDSVMENFSWMMGLM